MQSWHHWLQRWRRFRDAGRDIDDEIQAHLALAAQDRIARGEDPATARVEARRELGNPLLVREATRDIWTWRVLEDLLRDFRYALRQAARTPGFTAVAVLTLALGFGAITAMFSLVDGVLLRPLPFRDAGRLHLARTVPPPTAGIPGDFPVNARSFHEWRRRCQACDGIALVRYDELTLTNAGDPVRLPAFSVSYDFFRTLGLQPALGRDFEPGEESSLGQVILTDRLWRSRFGADPFIAGREIRINGESHTVAGVMPPGLYLPKGEEWGTLFGPQESPLIFRTIGVNCGRAKPNGPQNYSAIVRLKPSVPAERAASEMTALLADFHLVSSTRLVPFAAQVIRNARAALWLLLATVAIVLAMVCVNIGNLMLVRTAGRYREAGVRLALGAGRSQLFAMILREALLLVLAGGVLGLALAHTAIRAIQATAPVDLPRLEQVALDGRLLVFAGAVMALAALACCLFPAWRLARIEPLESLKAGSATTTESGRKASLREILVGVEVALATVLLLTGGLLLVSFQRLMQVDRGFDAARVITQNVSFLNPKYSHGARRNTVAELTGKFAAIPGVEAAAAVNQLPLIGEDWVGDLTDPDAPPRRASEAALVNYRFVTPDYLKAMGIPLRAGRFLDESDKERNRVAVSEGVARFLWPGRNPLGRHVQGGGNNGPSMEVVGVVADVHGAGLDGPPTLMIYEHYWRMQPVGMSFVLRARTAAAPVIRGVRSILSSADPEMAIEPALTMEEILDRSVAGRKFETALAAAFAAAALLIAMLGIHGVISYAVARRTPEIGIRVALGASVGQVLGMVLRQGMRPVLAGLAAGLVAALAAGRLLASQLYGVAPNDPATMAAVAAVLLVVAVVACSIPARRATRIDPVRALRFE